MLRLYEYRQKIMDWFDIYHPVSSTEDYYKMFLLYQNLVEEERLELINSNTNEEMLKEIIDFYWVSIWRAYFYSLYSQNENNKYITPIYEIEKNIYNNIDNSIIYSVINDVIKSNYTKDIPINYNAWDKIKKWDNYVAPDIKSIIEKYIWK